MSPRAELLVGVGLLAMAGAALALALLFRFVDRLPKARPNARSLHERPICRVGGLSIWAGWLPAMMLAPGSLPGGAAAWAAWAAVAVVSLVDDWRGVPPLPRLGVHLAAAVLAAATLPGVGGLVATVVAALTLAWSANLYNFMDGSDALAATMAACGFGALAAGAAIGGASLLPALALVAACLPLLAANAPPARIFMGDIGAVPLGFLAALLGLAGWGAGTWPAWFPLLVFLPFVADATRHARRAGVAPGARLGGAPVALLPAPAPAGRRAPGDAAGLRRADGRDRRVGGLRAGHGPSGLGGPRRLVCRHCGGFRRH